MKIIITKRIWQLIAVTGFLLVTIFARDYPPGFYIGIRLFISTFLIIFILTYMREERRTLYPEDSNMVINWNLIESILFLSSLLGYFLFAFIRHFDRAFFYAYLYTGSLGMMAGLAIGEFFWQNTQLRKFDELCQRRYWANYKDSIW